MESKDCASQPPFTRKNRLEIKTASFAEETFGIVHRANDQIKGPRIQATPRRARSTNPRKTQAMIFSDFGIRVFSSSKSETILLSMATSPRQD
ncbi:MAG TPA: hypothetical protein DCX32_03680 [Candidatus Moranbacteria bacterium]|nr:hypothetical protein [Candidatus Moranbacteria bacterium]